MDRLPADLTTNILSRLPVKYIFRCRSISKQWYSLIDKPEFVKHHIDSSTQLEIENQSSLILLPTSCDGQLFLVEYDASPSSEQGFVVKPSKMNFTCSDNSPFGQQVAQICDDNETDELYLIGYSRGLLCFSNFIDTKIYICNPATQEYVLLPYLSAPIEFHSEEEADVASGFAFDRRTNEFKVVQIFCSEDGRELQVQIFTLGSKSWRKVNGPCNLRDVVKPNFYIIGASLVFVGESFHWLALDSSLLYDDVNEHHHDFVALDLYVVVNEDHHDEEFLPVIVSFDLQHENFRVIPNPPVAYAPKFQVNYEKFRIGVLGGCLCVSDFYSQKDHCEIWVMKEYNVSQSWTKQYVIRKLLVPFSEPFVNIRAIFPVFVRKNGEVVLLCNSKFLVSYNPQNGTATPLEDDQLLAFTLKHGNRGAELYAVPFVASLISPKLVCGADTTYVEEESV